MSKETIEVDRPGADAKGQAPFGIHWTWSSLLLVQSRPSTDSPRGRISLLAPNQDGLGFVESFAEVQAVWLLRMSKDGTLTTEAVTSICHWHLVPEPDTHLTALLCSTGAIFLVDGEQVYEVDKIATRWIAEGRCKVATTD